MIELEVDGAIWTLKLNRPDRANALTEEMLTSLAGHVADASGKAKALILTGEGKVFSAGADLDEVKDGLATSKVWEMVSGLIASFPGLSVAALNGTLAGGAFGMVLAADIRIAVPEANFFYPVVKMGVLPQPSDPARLANLIGPARAKMLLLAGQKVGSEEAFSWGLIDRIVSDGDLMDVAKDLVGASLGADFEKIAQMRRMIAGVS